MWFTDANIRRVVSDASRAAKSDYISLKDKLQSCATSLQHWNKNCFGNVQQRIGCLKKKLIRLQDSPRTEEIARTEMVASNELDE